MKRRCSASMSRKFCTNCSPRGVSRVPPPPLPPVRRSTRAHRPDCSWCRWRPRQPCRLMPMALAAWVMEPCVPTRASSAMRPWPPRFSRPRSSRPSRLVRCVCHWRHVRSPVAQERGASVVHLVRCAHAHIGLRRVVVQAAGNQRIDTGGCVGGGVAFVDASGRQQAQRGAVRATARTSPASCAGAGLVELPHRPGQHGLARASCRNAPR